MPKPIRHIATGLLITLAVFWLVMLLPQFVVFVLLIPAVYIWLGFHLPTKWAYLAGSAFFIITSLVMNHPGAMMIGLFGGLIPIAMTLVAQRDYLEDALVKTVILAYGGLMASHYFFDQMYGIDFFAAYQDGLRLAIAQMATTGADISGMFNSLSESYLSMLFMLATVYAIGLFVIAWALKYFKLIDWAVQPFYTFRFKGMNLIQFGLIMLALFFLSSLELPFRLVGQNGWRFMMTLFSIQGISVAYFYLKRRKVSSVLSWLLLGFSLIMPLVNSLISLLGFSDSLFDFRKLEALK